MENADIPRTSITVNEANQVCIAFDHTDFADAEAIFFDYKDNSLHAYSGEDMLRLGSLPEDIADTFSSHMRLYLTALHPEGHMVVMDTRLQTLH